jgi:ATP-dependent 26S proteasome regulatory subunit
VSVFSETLLTRTLNNEHSVDRNKYQIQIPLPPKIDPSVTMMQVEEKPDITYSDIGGCKEQIEKLREVVETPLLSVRLCLPIRNYRNFRLTVASLSVLSHWVLIPPKE